MIQGLFYIFLFYYIGELISALINNFLPGSVIGMILLFLALFFKFIKPETVRGASQIIVKNMAIFFVPSAIGLMLYTDILMQSLPLVIVAIGVSTILTIISVAWTQQYFEDRKDRKQHKHKESDE